MFKNNMKKIIVGFMTLAILLSGSQSAFASGPFNGQSGDCNPGFGIGIYGNIQRDSQGCWSATSITASAGDTINVEMYYHNNTNSPLTNVRASIVKSSSGPANNYTFTGTMYSDQGVQTIGTATLNLTSSQTLTYSSTHIMNNANAVKSDTDTFVVNNDGGQISLGTVGTGWDNYGVVLAVFKVGSNNGGTTNNCYISSFTANGSGSTTVSSGSGFNLAWSTNNCSSVSVSGPNMTTSNSLSNSQYVYPSYSGQYTITAYGYNGGVQTQTVYVGIINNNNYNCLISNFTANGSSNVTVSSGSLVNLSWNTNNCSSVTVSGPNMSNNYNSSGNVNIYPTSSGQYTITAYGTNGGIQTQTVYVNMNTPIYNNTCAVTGIATNVTRNGATLNGVISNSSYYNTTGYFEYGPTVNLGYQTPTRTFTNGSFYEAINNLSADSSYYYRFVANCQNGTTRGSIESFVTSGDTVVRQVIVQGTTVVGNKSPIMLKIEDRYETIGVGDIIDYTITYKNIGKTRLLNPMLQVVVPKGITITNASAGTYSNDTHTLSVPLYDLLAGESGVVYAQGRADSIELNNARIVSTAILVYTNSNGAQENAMAYVLNSPKQVIATQVINDNNLGAAAFLAGIFPTGLIGWLILIILILLIILISRRYYTNTHSSVPPQGH
jgi:hypothetical protein